MSEQDESEQAEGAASSSSLGDSAATDAHATAQARRRLAAVSLLVAGEIGEHQETLCGKIRERTALAAVLLLAFMHYMMALRCVQAVACVKSGKSYRLGVDMQVECYVGRHRAVLPFAWALLVVYVIGFPLAALLMMQRAYARRRFHRLKTQFAFLTRSLHVRAFWFRLVSYFMNLVFAVQATLLRTSAMRVFIASLIFLANTIVVRYVKPFKSRTQNRIQMAIGIVNALQVVILLSLSRYGDNGLSDLLRNILLALVCAIVVIFAISVLIEVFNHCSHRAKKEHTEYEDEPAVESSVLSSQSSVNALSEGSGTRSTRSESSDSLSDLELLLKDHTADDGLMLPSRFTMATQSGDSQ
eukprot:c26740_g1_i1.p1 GENE.c26740_g1_i1~~c26740_g1_i1.p1  ORF type:complete len:381 (+),score=75.55 c26740_g1_i1:74-1144(+)